MEKKILVAVDGSPYGNNALRYLCQLFKDAEDVCFHLLSLIPSSGGAQQSQWQDQVDFMQSISPAGKQKKDKFENKIIFHLGVKITVLKNDLENFIKIANEYQNEFDMIIENVPKLSIFDIHKNT